MLGVDTIFIVAGAGLTVAVLEKVLEEVGKPEWAKFVKIGSTIVFFSFGAIQIENFFDMLNRTFLH